MNLQNKINSTISDVAKVATVKNIAEPTLEDTITKTVRAKNAADEKATALLKKAEEIEKGTVSAEEFGKQTGREGKAYERAVKKAESLGERADKLIAEQTEINKEMAKTHVPSDYQKGVLKNAEVREATKKERLEMEKRESDARIEGINAKTAKTKAETKKIKEATALMKAKAATKAGNEAISSKISQKASSRVAKKTDEELREEYEAETLAMAQKYDPEKAAEADEREFAKELGFKDIGEYRRGKVAFEKVFGDVNRSPEELAEAVDADTYTDLLGDKQVSPAEVNAALEYGKKIGVFRGDVEKSAEVQKYNEQKDKQTAKRRATANILFAGEDKKKEEEDSFNAGKKWR